MRNGWNTLLTIYYANSLSWRVLKAGGLFFFGFFLWAGSNVVLSYFHEAWYLRYALSYGFVLIFYGPFQHLVVIPVYQRFRKQGTNLSLADHLHLPNLSLVVFLVLVITLGMVPVGPMTIDFQSSLEGSPADVTADLSCVQGAENGATEVHCHLTGSPDIDRVVVKSGDETLVVDEDPPFEFTVRADNLQSTTGEKRFRVELIAEDGTMVRQYTRSLGMIPEG